MSVEILMGASGTEKRAYIAAIASIATADNVASDAEITYLTDLGKLAGLSDDDQSYVREAALDPSGGQLRDSLDVLKTSELRFSLVTDLIAFAESDQQLAEAEKTHISSVANYLGVDASQVKMLQQFVQQVAGNPAKPSSNNDTEGLMDKLKGSGIDMGMLTKGLISFVGPMILGNLLSKGMNKRGGKVGNAGLGNLGSIVSGLTGGKGMGGVGGFLSNLLR